MGARIRGVTKWGNAVIDKCSPRLALRCVVSATWGATRSANKSRRLELPSIRMGASGDSDPGWGRSERIATRIDPGWRVAEVHPTSDSGSLGNPGLFSQGANPEPESDRESLSGESDAGKPVAGEIDRREEEKASWRFPKSA